MIYRYQSVEKTPTLLQSEVVYINEEFEIATLLCPCGCNHKIVLLCPDGHLVINDGGFATVKPSIGVWDAPCRSHFFLNSGTVDWCNSWSEERIKSSMRMQRDRHVEAQPILTWYQVFKRWLARLNPF